MQNEYRQTSAKRMDFNAEEDFNSKSSQLTTGNLKVVKESEASIWADLKKGDKIALGKLYNIYIDSLFAFGIQNSQDRSFVMDCIHDLFLDLYKYRKNLLITDNAKNYLFKSLSRKINKKYSRKTTPESDEFINSKNKIRRNHTDSCEKDMIVNERNLEKKAALENALSTLTSKQRECLYLRFDQEKSYEEISFIMDVSVQSARTNIYRAIKSLRHYRINY
ncbi:RNA polymerase sigma factor [Mariniflexile sp.]|uniref:RNA polymerase sigma factor n=1 Tax=Mariniflexile sp. TaxID=1979402 RepID=UPI00356883FA